MKKISDNGFTMVELMIVIAVIGILASVAGVQFKTYSAKSKSSEAKIQLASIYTSEKIFLNEFDMYSNCLTDLGFESAGSTKRFFALGFPSITAAINAGVHAQALANGLPVGTCSPTLAPTLNNTYFLAGNGVGNAVMDNLGDFQAAIPTTSNSLSEAGPTTSSDVQEGLGSMLTENTKSFTAAAAGFISTSAATPGTSSLWTIDHNKSVRVVRTGY